MASLNRTLQDAARSLRGLTVSQRLAIGFGAALVAAALLWMVQWASTSEMVPLLDQTLAAEEVAAVRSGLELLDEPYKLDGARVLVRASANRQALFAQLQQLDKMPNDTSLGFMEMVKEANPWLSQEESNRRWTVALQNELDSVLARLSGVKEARVFLNINNRERGFSRQGAESKASVTLIMKSGETMSRNLALNAARLVSGAVRGLPMRNVEVVDANGGAALDWEGEESEAASVLQRLTKQAEQQIAGKLREQLAFDRHLRVSVQAVLDPQARSEQRNEPIEGVPVEKSKSEAVTSRNRQSNPPGVEINTGVAAAGSDSGESSTTTTEDTKLQAGHATSTTSNPAGSVKQVFAAINVSYTYLLSVFHRNNPADAKPSESDIQKIFDDLKTRIVSQAVKLVTPQDPEQVAVDWYYDSAEAEQPREAGSMDTTIEMASRYGPVAGLGVLALVGLTMMMRMARQKDVGESFGIELGLPKEAIDAAKRAAEDLNSHLGASPRGAYAGAEPDAGSAPAAMAGGATAVPLPVGMAAEGVLEAQEVDEATVQINNMIDQVASMVNEDEEAVATLVEKWVDSRRD